jgi:hypothetical protein
LIGGIYGLDQSVAKYFSFFSKFIFVIVIAQYHMNIQQKVMQELILEMIEKQQSRIQFRLVIENLQESIIIFSGK